MKVYETASVLLDSYKASASGTIFLTTTKRFISTHIDPGYIIKNKL